MKRLSHTIHRAGRVGRDLVAAAEEIAHLAWSYRYEVLAAVITEILWALLRAIVERAVNPRHRKPGRVIPFPRPA